MELDDATTARMAASDTDEIARLSKHELIMFGIAALTLDAARVDMGHPLPDPIASEQDQFIALTYMLRCAPAHDIAMPHWKIKARFARPYTVDGITIDLSHLDGAAFDFSHIGGPRVFTHIARIGRRNGWV
ncbi:hypothetical protein GB928_018650 [Shinella curvata]|uniref:Uncharacterized protein n=1 Tax=Shinella curvata TaxID=1817964 RepID=A0ABT8XHP3_9HYPH|nr:hypothetical protein [Shinella curvata]MCJ8053880.1 hypothetical protein [Shinella curvata]MDO6123212.1 hypothetical protein [Shinella curvata]